MFFSRNTEVPCSGELLSFRCSKLAKVFTQLAGTCPVPPKRDRRGQGAQYERNFLCSHFARHCVPGKPRPVGGELHIKRRTIGRDPVFLRARPVSVPKSIASFRIGGSHDSNHRNPLNLNRLSEIEALHARWIYYIIILFLGLISVR
jgi:hypothetical protein